MRTVLAASAILLAAIPGVARAAETPCLTAAEFSGVASYALPSVITGTTLRCSATLPASSYLRSNGTQLAARYAAGKASAWPVAKAAFLRVGNTGDQAANALFANLPDQSMQTMLDALIEGAVSQQIPTERCATIDQLVRVLAPLPAESTAELIALAAGLGAQSNTAKVGGFKLCPA